MNDHKSHKMLRFGTNCDINLTKNKLRLNRIFRNVNISNRFVNSLSKYYQNYNIEPY